MTRTVKFGVIGAGVGATFALRALKILEKEGVAEAVAVSSPHRAKVRAEEFALSGYYVDYKEMLRERGIDAVFISTPHYLHFPMALDSISAGIHTLVDKPMAMNLNEADEMIRRARVAGVKLGVCLQSRFDPKVLKIKEVLDSGRLGRLLLGEAIVKWFRTGEYYEKSFWRGRWSTEGGGALINQAIHTIDLLLWMTGDVDYLWALSAPVLHNIEVEDLSMATLKFKNGAFGSIQASTALYPGFPTRLELYGTNGAAILEGEMIKLLHIKGEEPYSEEEAKEGLESWARPEAAPPLNHAASIRDFAEAILKDREPKVTGEEGRRSIEVIKAIHLSGKTGKVVNFPLT